MNNYWIFCCGAKRSGSTLQYQITAELVEKARVGKRIEFVPPNDFHKVKEKYKEYKGLKIFKTHVLTKDILNEFNDNNAKGIYIFRDIRDVLVSMMEKDSISHEEIIKGIFIDEYLEYYEKWMSIPNLYVSKYENVIIDLLNEIKQISKFLDIVLDGKEYNSIATKLNIKNQKKIIEKIKSTAKVIERNTFDSETLLHWNHINSGAVNQWKEKLTDSHIFDIELRTYDWIVKNGYDVYSDTKLLIKDRAKYYSQHGEDYLLWNFFDHKENGFFVDIGAFDGIHFSNTYSFEKEGWAGICIEPHPKYFPLCKKNRLSSICLDLACVGNEKITDVEFTTEKIGLLSGIIIDEDDVANRYQNRCLSFDGFKSVKVRAQTLNSILAKYLKGDQPIDLISIDVEGTELDVLKGLDLKKYKPKILLIEANNDLEKNKLINFINQFPDYHYVREIGVNIIFVNGKENIDILRRLKIECKFERQKHPLGEEYTIQSSLNWTKGQYNKNKKYNFMKKNLSKVKSIIKGMLFQEKQ